MTYTVSTAPVREGKDAVVINAGESTATAIATVIPDGSVGVMIDDAAGFRFSGGVITKLEQMRDLINENGDEIIALVDGVAVSFNGNKNGQKPDIVKAQIADNTSSALTAAMGTGQMCLVVSGDVGHTELPYSAARRAIDAMLEQVF